MTGTLVFRLLGLITSLGFGYLVFDYQGEVESDCRAVTGVVRLDGRLLERGAIRFLPVGDTRSVGAAAEIVHGAYAVSDLAALPAGKYRVCFSGLGLDESLGTIVAGEHGESRANDPVPSRFNWESQVQVEIAENDGTLGFDFDLK